MSVDPGGTFSVECDNCGESKDFDITEYCGDPPTWGIDSDTLALEGWAYDGGEVFCKDCLELLEEESE
jgi:hypothetical protein